MQLFDLFSYKKDKYLFSWFCFGFILGINIFIFSNIFYSLVFWIVAIVVAFYCRDLEVRIFLIAALLGFGRTFLQTEFIYRTNVKPTSGEVEVEGYIEEGANNIYRLRIKCLTDSTGKTYNNKNSLLLSCSEEIAIGSTVLCSANIYPFSGVSVFDSRDNRIRYFFERIIGCGEIIRIRSNFKPDVSSRKSFLSAKIERNFSQLEANFIKALLFGETSADPEMSEYRKTFRKLGISHLLAISGLHFSLFGGVLYLLGRWFIGPLILPKSVALQNIGSTFSLIGFLYYSILAKPSWSVIRSIFMFIIPLVLLFISRRSTLYQNCVISLFIISFIWPYSILDPGFQLSFVAVFSLALFRGNLIRSTLNVLFITTPFLLYWFRYVSLQPFIACLICVPIFSFILMPLLVISSIFGFPKLLCLLLSKSVQLFLYTTYLLGDLFIIEAKFLLGEVAIVIWIISLISWILIRNITLVFLGFIYFLASLKPIPKSLLLIDRSCKNFAFFEDQVLYVTDLDSFHSKICSEILSAKEVKLIGEDMKKNDKLYLWKNLEIITQQNGKFVKIRKNGKTILKSFDLIFRNSPCRLDLTKMEAVFSDGSKLLLD